MDTFELNGVEYAYTAEPDDCQDSPWDNGTCRGPVRQVRGHYSYRYGTMIPYGKSPGERVLHLRDGTFWLYDWQAAAKQARSDGCKDIAGAVQADFDYLQGWLNGDWHYYVVSCWAVSDPDNVEYLCGVESSCILQCAKDIAPAPYVHVIGV